MDNKVNESEEVDIFEHAERGQEVPHAHAYRVRIDGESFRVETPTPTGEALLGKVHKRPCGYELIEEFKHKESEVVEPGEQVDLRKRGLKGFITAHKEIVTIFINPSGTEGAYQITRGEHTVAEILAKVGQTPEGYVLLQEKDGPPLPIPASQPVKIAGCELFYTQPQSGSSS